MKKFIILVISFMVMVSQGVFASTWEVEKMLVPIKEKFFLWLSWRWYLITVWIFIIGLITIFFLYKNKRKFIKLSPKFSIPAWIPPENAALIIDWKITTNIFSAMMFKWIKEWYVEIQVNNEYNFVKRSKHPIFDWDHDNWLADYNSSPEEDFRNFCFSNGSIFSPQKILTDKNSIIYQIGWEISLNEKENMYQIGKLMELEKIPNKLFFLIKTKYISEWREYQKKQDTNITPGIICCFLLWWTLSSIGIWYPIAFFWILWLLVLLRWFYLWRTLNPAEGNLNDEWVEAVREVISFKNHLKKMKWNELKDYFIKNPNAFDEFLPYIIWFWKGKKRIKKVSKILPGYFPKWIDERYKWERNMLLLEGIDEMNIVWTIYNMLHHENFWSASWRWLWSWATFGSFNKNCCK